MNLLAFVGLAGVFAVLFGIVATVMFMSYKLYNEILKRDAEMIETTQGEIVDLKITKNRNRTFRWKNEFPVIAYTVNGKRYECEAVYAERLKGTFRIGETYEVRYVPNDPEACIVNAFYKDLKRYRKTFLVVSIILGWCALGMMIQIIRSLIAGTIVY